VDVAVGEWWTRFQRAGEAERAEMLLQEGEPKKRRRRRKRKKRDEGEDVKAEG
jgi:hypothetical protein